MSDQTADGDQAATAINVQRLESGYFDHLESLRTQIPVGNYLIDGATQRWALVSMAVISLIFLVTFPFTMFIQYTPVVILLYMIAFVAFCRVFYDRVLEPNEGTEEWED
jgi:hypothetical protein